MSATQRRRFLSNDHRNNSARSLRSNSPPDLLNLSSNSNNNNRGSPHHHHYHDSSNSLDMLGGDNVPMGDHSWTPPSSFSARSHSRERRLSGGDTIPSGSGPRGGRHPTSLLMRHHSGDNTSIRSPRPNPPSHTYSGGSVGSVGRGGGSGGARQRQPILSTNSGGGSNSNTNSNNQYNLSPFVRKSPKRNLTGDFASSSSASSFNNKFDNHAQFGSSSGNTHVSHNNHHQHHHQHNNHHHHNLHHRDDSSSSMTNMNTTSGSSPPTPYGMLNPGPLKGHKPSSSIWGWRQAWYNMFSSSGSSYGHPYNPHHHHHPYPYGHSSGSNNKQLIALFGFCTLALLGVAVYQHDAWLQDALQLKEQEVDHHILHAKELEKRLQTLRQHSLELEEKLEKSEGEPHIDLETQRKLFHLEHNQLKMQKDIQSMSKRLLKEKYGHGPHYYVQMKLEFDPQSNVYQDEEAGDVVIIETASINDMPHSIYLFLEQVDHHLYDHTSFHRNAAHLIQAGPSGGSVLDSNHHIMLDSHHHLFRHHPSLQSVIFQEYVPEMTHKQYTLGYPGRPGGPDFYINMRDNSAINGPQRHHQLHTNSHGLRHGDHRSISSNDNVVVDADPCFARVVKGYNAIERIHRSTNVLVGDSSTGPNSDVMEYPVLIAYMKVLPPDYVVTHSDSSDSVD